MRLGRRYGPLVDIYALGCNVYECCRVLSGQYDVPTIFLSCAAENDRDIVAFRSTWHNKLAILTNSSCYGLSDDARSPFLTCLTQEASNGRARAEPLTYSLDLRQAIIALLRFDVSDRCHHRQTRASQRFRKVMTRPRKV